MRTTITLVYVVMAVWLLLAAAARIALLLSAGQDLDALPFISGAFGLVALVLLLPAYEDRRSRGSESVGRPSRNDGDDLLG